MAALAGQKSLTIRLSPDLYTSATRLARKRGISLNALLQESLAATVRAEQEQSRYDAYTLLGQDLEERDVEYAVPAQAEVMLRREP